MPKSLNLGSQTLVLTTLYARFRLAFHRHDNEDGNDTTKLHSPKSRRSIFLTEGSTPRRRRRVLVATLGHHHKPFGSAGTARGLRALDLVGALHALWRAERRGAREKGLDQDR